MSSDNTFEIIELCERQEQPQKVISKWKAYKEYLDSGFGLALTSGLLVLFIFTQFSAVVTDYWVSIWANEEYETSSDSVKQYTNVQENTTATMFTNDTDIYSNSSSRSFTEFKRGEKFTVYWILALITFILLVLRPIIYYLMCVKAASQMFYKLLDSIIYKKFDFFIKHSDGEIMNRFNRDQGVVDEALPSTNFDFIQIASFILITFGLSIWVNPVIIIPLLPICIFLYKFRSYYIKTSRNLKVLEADARSPLLDHLNSTNAGLATIRSANKAEFYTNQYHNIMNNYTRVNFPFITAKRWFALRLDIVITIFIAIVIIGAILVKVYLKNYLSITPASIGILIAYCFQLSTQFQFCIRQSCDAETSMISVERICEYNDESKFPREPQNSNEILIDRGEIEFKKVSFRYKKSGNYVLRNVNLKFESGERIGIIGHNGAGKSTIFNTLLRLYEIEQGDICIDGTSIKDISLEDLRQKITIVPQDPILFSGTLRENLDPLRKCQDSEILEKLQTIKMNKTVDDLKAPINERLGKGEKQLLCFVRGLLKGSKIY